MRQDIKMYENRKYRQDANDGIMKKKSMNWKMNELYI